jgi:hypothetical protein
MMSQQPSSAGNTLSANPNQLGVRGLSGDPAEFRKSHAFDYRHGAPIEHDGVRSPSRNERSDASIKFLPPKYDAAGIRLLSLAKPNRVLV